MIVFSGEVDGVGRKVGDGVLAFDADPDMECVTVGATDSEGVTGKELEGVDVNMCVRVGVGASDIVWGRVTVWVWAGDGVGGTDSVAVWGTDVLGVEMGLLDLVPVFGGWTDAVLVASFVTLLIGVRDTVKVLCFVGVGGGVSVWVSWWDGLAVVDGVGGGSIVVVRDTVDVGRDEEGVGSTLKVAETSSVVDWDADLVVLSDNDTDIRSVDVGCNVGVGVASKDAVGVS